MVVSPMSYYLPAKIPGYLLRLSHHYAGDTDNATLKSLIDAARVYVDEGIQYDNWDGGTYGHDVRLYLPLEALAAISPKQQEKLTETLTRDLRGIAPQRPGEFISTVVFELNDENDADFQQAVSICEKPVVSPDALTIWKPSFVRVFITHRDEHKAAAQDLAQALEGYGFSCFVAHDTIAPMTEWRLEIMRGLETMEVMLVFLTDDFHESTWTNQEVGYALGVGTPIICVKLGKADPAGFIGHIQAMKAKLDEPDDAAARLYPLLRDALGARTRLQTGVVKAFAESPSWGETTIRFQRLEAAVEKLTDGELQMIIDAYYRNDQLYGATYLTHQNNRRLRTFLEKTTGNEFDIHGRKISLRRSDAPDEIPF